MGLLGTKSSSITMNSPRFARYYAAPPTPTPSVPPQPIRRPVTLRARPFLFISTFLSVHQVIATSSLIPAYALFNVTDYSTAFLAGPYAVFVMRQPVPWPISSFTKEERVGDVIDRMLKGSIAGGYRMFKKYRERKEANRDSDAVEGAEGKGKWRAAAAARWKKAKDTGEIDSESAELAEDAVKALEGKPGWRDPTVWKTRALEKANTVGLKNVMDFAAAYLAVKALLPVRLAASIFLTPTFARLLARL